MRIPNKFILFTVWKDSLKTNWSERLTLYSYGNDYQIIEDNLDLHNYSNMSKFSLWETSFF